MRISLYFSIGKGLPFWYIGKRQTTHLTQNERPRTVRRKKADLHARVNDNLKMEFTGEGLTSYAGLELLMRYLRNVDWNRQLRRHLGSVGFGGDFGVVSLCRVLLGLLWVGGRRLRHLDFLKGDPLLQRFCGLTDLPTPRSVSTFLRRFSDKGLNALKALNADVVAHKIKLLRARKLTIDVDGTVLCTGKRVGGARRGYNPHHRKVPSYYPITAYLADSGHFLGVHNRAGNVNDGSASILFLKDVFSQIKETLGHAYTLRFRMDGAFFKEDVVNTLIKNKASYAIKVPFWKGLDLQHKIRQCSHWQRIEKGVDGFTSTLTVKKWKRTLNIAIFRKRVMHQTRKNYQLDLFDPDDGTFEYSAVATNLPFKLRALWRFMAGRGAHEKAIGELKTGQADGMLTQNRRERLGEGRRGDPLEIQRRNQRIDRRCPAHISWQDGRTERLVLTPVVHTRLPDLKVSYARDQFPWLVRTIPDHLTVATFIFLVLQVLDVGFHFKIQRGLQHPPGPDTNQGFQAQRHFIFDYRLNFGACILSHRAYPFSLV